MKSLSTYIKRHITQNRRNCLLLVIKTYGVNYPGLWRSFGYSSVQDYEKDVTQQLHTDLIRENK
ncbi:hypothetical protein [Psychromonas ossibalaenae]|uniref:hypothetical protein n=1 Tax=Psychromonas ossibalaenae TaxID=444922 RepID=UPI00037FA442|nr:hypothetical protein [Psychromonas ossibalaenae]